MKNTDFQDFMHIFILAIKGYILVIEFYISHIYIDIDI